MAKLETLERHLKEYTSATVTLNDFGLVAEKTLGNFKNSLTVTVLSDNSAYRCMGSIYLKDDWYSVELVEVTKTVRSETEVIWLIQNMSNSVTEIKECLKKQKECLNH